MVNQVLKLTAPYKEGKKRVPSLVLCVIGCEPLCEIKTWNKRQLKLILDYF